MKASRIVIIWRYPGFFKVGDFEVSRIVISCRYPGSFIDWRFPGFYKLEVTKTFINWRYPGFLQFGGIKELETQMILTKWRFPV